MFDIIHSHASLVLEKPVMPSAVVTTEGLILVSVLDGGVEKVQPSAGVSGEKVVGYSVSDNQTITSVPVVEEHTVPASGTLSFTLDHLPMGSFGASTVSAYDGTTMLTEAAVGSESTDKYSVDYTTGLVTMGSTYAGKTIKVIYRRAVTVMEAQMLFHQRNINNTSGAVFNQVGVGCGVGELFTAEYDTTADWSGTTREVKSGPDGKLTIGGNGSVVGTLIQVPSAENSFVGIHFVL